MFGFSTYNKRGTATVEKTIDNGAFFKHVIQPKLTINQPNDVYEQEADAVADNVMRMPANENAFFKPAAIPIQRKCAHCDEEEKKARRKEINSNETGSDNELDNYVSSLSDKGEPLSHEAKTFFEPKMGYDFSNVKVHTNAVAAKSAQSINALAYTVGNNIVFNNGRYQPHTETGKKLLAHELTHTVQQNANPQLQQKTIQRDLAVEPTAPTAEGRTLTSSQMSAAIRWNRVVFTNAEEIALLRDVLGISQQPATIDEDFVNALVQYQANFGLTQDGLLGAGTALRLANELQGEASFMGADADVASTDEMALNPAQRRMRLRSRVANRLGNLLHQDFVGPAGNPTGIVTVRSGVDYQSMCGTTIDCRNGIQLDYTGANADTAHWLQFMHVKMFATHPTSGARVFQTGSTLGSGGGLTYSNDTTTNWTVDSSSTTDPFYEAGFTNQRTAGANTSIFDQPQGWQGVADSFAGSATFTSRPAAVTFVLGFDTHLVVNDRSVYHVRWNIAFRFNTSVTPATDTGGTYSLIAAGSTSGLPTNLRTALVARYPTSVIR